MQIAGRTLQLSYPALAVVLGLVVHRGPITDEERTGYIENDMSPSSLPRRLLPHVSLITLRKNTHPVIRVSSWYCML